MGQMNRAARLAVGVVALVLLAGCATASTDMAFDQAEAPGDNAADKVKTDRNLETVADDEAILVVAVGAISVGGGYGFRTVEADGSGFGKVSATFSFGAWGIGDRMKRPEGERPLRDEINFLIRKVPAGRYAATQASWNTFNGYSSGSAWRCLQDGAPTFEVAPGSITLISSRDAFPPGTITRVSASHSDGNVLSEFARTRVSYPMLKGEPVLARPGWQTRWSPRQGMFVDSCNSVQDGTFSVIPVHSAVKDAEPDEAEQAAIAAALENIKKQAGVSPTAGQGN